jgi:hypothetical protein
VKDLIVRTRGRTLGDSEQFSGVSGEYKAGFPVVLTIKVAFCYIPPKATLRMRTEIAYQLIIYTGPRIPFLTCLTIVCLEHSIQVDRWRRKILPAVW